MRTLLIQYAGDFRDAHRRLQTMGEETYHGHRYVLDQLAELREASGPTAIMCCLTNDRYHEYLPSGVEVMGAAAHPIKRAGTITSLIDKWNPSHLVVQGPMQGIIRWGVRHRREVLVILASSFESTQLTDRLKRVGLARTLNHPGVGWVTNHGVNAARSAVRVGVSADKLIPWDWPHARDPRNLPAKELARDARSLVYVGSVSERKGVWDLLRAMSMLRDSGESYNLDIIGGGDTAQATRLVADLDLSDRVRLRGVLSNDVTFEAMRDADVVVVPSRRSYPEGLPLTIYEALAARTPIVASDHPMFEGHLRDRETAMIFPETDAEALATTVHALLSNASLYHRLSASGVSSWEAMQNPVKWGEVLRRWVRGSNPDRAWLQGNTLAALDARSDSQDRRR